MQHKLSRVYRHHFGQPGKDANKSSVEFVNKSAESLFSPSVISSRSQSNINQLYDALRFA